MRISFPNKEQDDTLVGAGETRIGTAADNGITVAGTGVACALTTAMASSSNS